MGRMSLRQPQNKSVRAKSRWKLFVGVGVLLNIAVNVAVLLKVFELL